MTLSPGEVRQRLAVDLGSGYEPSLDPARIAVRARRTQRRRVVFGSAATALVVAAAIGLGTNGGNAPSPDRRGLPASSPSPTASDVPRDIHTDTENSPPEKFIAAGRIAVSAIFTRRIERIDDDLTMVRRTWSLYNPKTGEYERTDWAWLDVAPGLQLAAVLDGDLPAKRIGILDMQTRDVSWVEVEHGVAGLAWSPDGTKVLATVYTENPDVRTRPYAGRSTTRTGYVMLDVASGQPRYHALPPVSWELESEQAPVGLTARRDLAWSADGSKIWSPKEAPEGLFYTLDGQPILPEGDQKKPNEPAEYVPYTAQPAVSPNGKLAIGRQSGLPTSVVDRATGEVVGEQPVLQLLAWATNDHLIALGGCPSPCKGKDEFRTALFLVSVDGKESVQLSSKKTGEDGGWSWLLTQR